MHHTKRALDEPENTASKRPRLAPPAPVPETQQSNLQQTGHYTAAVPRAVWQAQPTAGPSTPYPHQRNHPQSPEYGAEVFVSSHFSTDERIAANTGYRSSISGWNSDSNRISERTAGAGNIASHLGGNVNALSASTNTQMAYQGGLGATLPQEVRSQEIGGLYQVNRILEEVPTYTTHRAAQEDVPHGYDSYILPASDGGPSTSADHAYPPPDFVPSAFQTGSKQKSPETNPQSLTSASEDRLSQFEDPTFVVQGMSSRPSPPPSSHAGNGQLPMGEVMADGDAAHSLMMTSEAPSSSAGTWVPLPRSYWNVPDPLLAPSSPPPSSSTPHPRQPTSTQWPNQTVAAVAEVLSGPVDVVYEAMVRSPAFGEYVDWMEALLMGIGTRRTRK